jgi:replicative DNA helicase
MNKVTKGGIPNKSLSVILAATGVGKSLFMCHQAADYLLQGINVLYITMEMAEERIAERIDENLMDITMDDLQALPKVMFDKKIESIKSKTNGKLIIKEYPTSSAHSGHFRALIQELKSKKNFIPQVIFIDYLNICASSRCKGLSNSVNSYTMVKSIAEELRSLAVEFNVPIWTATQTNRDGYDNMDLSLSEVSESSGLAATADFFFGLVTSEQLQKLGQMMGIQLKNRFNDINSPKKFFMGVDKTKMKLYDVENNAQIAAPVSVDNKENPFGSTIAGIKKSKFGDFKV